MKRYSFFFFFLYFIHRFFIYLRKNRQTATAVFSCGSKMHLGRCEAFLIGNQFRPVMVFTFAFFISYFSLFYQYLQYLEKQNKKTDLFTQTRAACCSKISLNNTQEHTDTHITTTTHLNKLMNLRFQFEIRQIENKM